MPNLFVKTSNALLSMASSPALLNSGTVAVIAPLMIPFPVAGLNTNFPCEHALY